MVPPFGVAGSKENFFLLRIKSPAYDTHWPFYIFPTNRQFRVSLAFFISLEISGVAGPKVWTQTTGKRALASFFL